MTSVRDKAVRLFTYLRELCKLHTTHIKDVAKYDQVLWFSEIPQEPDCDCVAWRLWPETDDETETRHDTWIEVRKPKLEVPPDVPDEELEPWLKEEELSNSEIGEPGIYDEIEVVSEPSPGAGEELTETLSIDDHPHVFDMWVDYVESCWKPWAERDRRLQAVQRVYNGLYTIYQRAERLGEQYEVIVGLGFLLWRSPNSGDIRHPLLAYRARVEFDSRQGILRVVPAEDGPDARLEIDMLETEDRPEVPDQQAIEEKVDRLNNNPWDSPALEDVLTSLANGVSTETRYERSVSHPAQIDAVPQLHLAPALILRRRTQRTFVDFYDTMVEQLEADCEVPDGIRGLVEIIDRETPTGESDPNERSCGTPGTDPELYFPLEANDEQKQIAQLVERHNGVLVQGPPGTGKSHTIANLIAHFLATGQRVLVTSQTPRALEVLRKWLPKEIRELCVVWLGSGPEAQESLKQSVHAITQRRQNWNKSSAAGRISQLQQRLVRTRSDQQRLQRELTSCREKETYQHADVFDVYSGTLAKIARRISDERERYEWFLDRPGPADELTVTAADLLKMRQTDRTLTPEQLRQIESCQLPMSLLVAPAEFSQFVSEESRLYEAHKQAERKLQYPGCQLLRSLGTSERRRLLILLKRLATRLEEYEKHFYQWIGQAAREVAAGHDRKWRALHDFTQEQLRSLSSRCGEVSALSIVGLDGRDQAEVAVHARELKHHLQSGEGLGFFGLFRAESVKRAWYLTKDVRVNGQPCKSADELKKLLLWLDFERGLQQLADRWRTFATPPEGECETQLAAYKDLCEPLEGVIALDGAVAELKESVSQLPGLATPRWHESGDLTALCNAIEAIDISERLKQARKRFTPLERAVEELTGQPDAHPATLQLADAIRKRDAPAYREAYVAVSRLNELRGEYTNRCNILQRFMTSCPMTAEAYQAGSEKESWDGRFSDIPSAWNWARADRWVRELCTSERDAQLAAALDRSHRQELTILEQLAAEKAWQHCMTRLGEPERQALEAWRLAVRRIGRGVGRHAGRYREEARQKLAQCRNAIPAWVMPLYQVVQTTNPRGGLFDVVIVDEASQSGPQALLLHYIAKKMIVVGDDEQIAPLNVGIDRDDVVRLRQMHLAEIEHPQAFELEFSLFDQAVLRFPASVRLREHFRCMPEIIQFSNNLSYSDSPLIPLRQFGADRLEPIKTTPVEDGFRKGRSPHVINEPEAQAIVKQIVQCLEDSDYEGKTFGVISLLGNAQALRIGHLLMQEVGAEEIEDRALVCGNPYDFQGNERDVIFLSMVDAPQDGRTCRKWRDQKTQRSYNVAASRAKDQLWLFHTPTLNELRTDCLRYRLLEYCLHPSVRQDNVAGLDLNELRRLASSGARGMTDAPDPFDSWFEVDVFIRIADRGYRVLPQFEVAGRRIDLVVEGLEGQLAVECHGDAWHPPEQFEKDAERQRQLERCGWTFWTVRGGQFYHDPEGALQTLWRQLDDLEIYPEQRWEVQKHSRAEVRHATTETPPAEIEDEPEWTGSDGNTSSTSIADRIRRTERANGKDGTLRTSRTSARATAVRQDTSSQRTDRPTARQIQQAIVSALKDCPHHTCTEKSVTTRVLKQLNIRTRGNPWAELDRRVRRNVIVLIQKGVVESYKSKNKRLRLRDGQPELF